MELKGKNGVWTYNGNPISGWKVVLILAAIAIVAIPLMAGFAMLFAAALGLFAIVACYAGIYRLLAGHWPSWFTVETSRTESFED